MFDTSCVYTSGAKLLGCPVVMCRSACQCHAVLSGFVPDSKHLACKIPCALLEVPFDYEFLKFSSG